jgi:probable HAF family extracellular repeat protein
MTPMSRGRIRGRLQLAAAGALVFTALTVSTALAALPLAEAGVATAAPPRRAATSTTADGAGATGDHPGSRTGGRPRSPIPGFLLDRGRYTTIEAPDPGVLQYPFDVNDRGQITGEYVRVGPDGIPDSESGFVQDKRGRTTVLDVPGAKGTEAIKLNNRGQVAGTFSTDTPIVNDSASPHGYLWDRGKVTRIDVPGAAGTGGNGVNDRGQVVGAYTDAAGAVHGYLWDKGRFTTIDAPGAVRTAAFDVNNRRQVVGHYLDTGGAMHGFLWERGRFVTIDAPGAPLTTAEGINDRGQIVGFSAAGLDLTGARGFLLAKRVTGPFTPISVPGAPRTVAEGINNRGQIVGFYENPNATPSPRRAGTQPAEHGAPSADGPLTGRG